MSNDPTDIQRRTVLQISATLAAAGPMAMNAALAAAVPPAPTGKPGDFDFLGGQWKIKNRQLKAGNWDRFDSEAKVFGILGGVASVEELRIPAQLQRHGPAPAGPGAQALGRLLGQQQERCAHAAAFVGQLRGRRWALWDSDDKDGEQPIIVRGAWDQITPTSCRWYQAMSRGGGKRWQDSWLMHWTRA